jgi:hypothetical protein
VRNSVITNVTKGNRTNPTVCLKAVCCQNRSVCRYTRRGSRTKGKAARQKRSWTGNMAADLRDHVGTGAAGGEIFWLRNRRINGGDGVRTRNLCRARTGLSINHPHAPRRSGSGERVVHISLIDYFTGHGSWGGVGLWECRRRATEE